MARRWRRVAWRRCQDSSNPRGRERMVPDAAVVSPGAPDATSRESRSVDPHDLLLGCDGRGSSLRTRVLAWTVAWGPRTSDARSTQLEPGPAARG